MSMSVAERWAHLQLLVPIATLFVPSIVNVSVRSSVETLLVLDSFHYTFVSVVHEA